MPHFEIQFTDDLNLDARAILEEVEAIILSHDSGAGDCKGRAFPVAQWHHTHVKGVVSLLPKPHRGAAFVAALQEDVFAAISARLPRPCWLSIDISFSGPGYRTEFLT